MIGGASLSLEMENGRCGGGGGDHGDARMSLDGRRRPSAYFAPALLELWPAVASLFVIESLHR